MPTRDKLKNMIWRVVNISIFRITPPPHLTLFRRFRALLVRLFGGNVSWQASLHPTANIDYPWHLTMAAKASLGEKSWVYAMAPISIGEYSCIGKDVYLLTGSHDIEKSTFDLIMRPISIGKGCWIATASTILPGITIGDYSVVAANSVVVKNVEPSTVVGGNPAKFIKKRIIRE